MSVLHFRKELTDSPVAMDAAGFCVRQLHLPDDIQAWLALRDRAMKGEIPAARPWTEADFQREFLGKPWWRDEFAWTAVATPTTSLSGSVFLGLREGADRVVPVIHWLLVDPAFRRRGVARALMSSLERAAWDAGWREVQLETHTGWVAAVSFYQSIGYAPVGGRSPR